MLRLSGAHNQNLALQSHMHKSLNKLKTSTFTTWNMLRDLQHNSWVLLTRERLRTFLQSREGKQQMQKKSFNVKRRLSLVLVSAVLVNLVLTISGMAHTDATDTAPYVSREAYSQAMLLTIMEQMKKAWGVTEELKAAD